MARPQNTSPRSLLQQLVPTSEIRRQARRLGFQKRRRKIDVVDFVLTVVFCLGRRDGQSLAGLRRSLALEMGVRVARSSFWERFTPAFERLLQWLVERLEEHARNREVSLPGPFAGFEDLVALDATVITTRRSRVSKKAGRKQMPPSVKVYTRIRALTGELLRHRVFSDKIHDVRASLSESWRQGVLYLFDMGFSSVFLWKRICEDGAYFLTRLNDNFEPVVVATNRRYRHHPSPEGIRLRMMCRRLKKTTIDAQCRFDLREPGGREPIDSVEFRVIALWNFKQRKHHFYVTNVPPGVLRAELIADAYRLRWEVETFYKVGKSGLGLEDIRANRPQVINSLIRAALIRASISMQAMLKAEEAVPKRRWLNPHAWAIVWRDVVEKLVPGLRSHGRSASKQHVGWRWIAALAVDPNRKRPPTRVRIRRMRAVPSG